MPSVHTAFPVSARSLLACGMVVGVLYAPTGWAQKIYQCKDVTGRLITSDRPIPECEKTTMKELGRDGVYRRDIPPPLTPEQIRQREEAEEKRKLQEVAKRDQERRDAALLSIYRSEQDIQAARERALTLLQKDMEVSRKRAANNGRELAGLQKEVASYGKRPVPMDVQRRLNEMQMASRAENTLQEELQGHLLKTNQRYDADLLRFREIMGHTAAGNVPR